MLGWRRNARRSFECEPFGDANALGHGNCNSDAVSDTQRHGNGNTDAGTNRDGNRHSDASRIAASRPERSSHVAKRILRQHDHVVDYFTATARRATER